MGSHSYSSQLRKLSRRLIEAQEEESRRIARELHDDLSQRLSLLAANLDHLRQDVAVKCPRPASRVIRTRLEALWRGASEILSDVESISHELHSSTIEQLGLVDGLRLLCKSVARRSGVEIAYIARHDLPEPTTKDVSLCVYRVVQEALRNAIQHSGAKKARVAIKAHGRELHVSIADTGKGFDPEGKKGGLGLLSIRERVHLVGGQLTIESRRHHGTKVIARIPTEPTSRRSPRDTD